MEHENGHCKIERGLDYSPVYGLIHLKFEQVLASSMFPEQVLAPFMLPW